MSRVVGIDLGTTNSLVASVIDGVPLVIRDESGDGLLPSVVTVDEGGNAFVGREAQRRLLTDPTRTAYSVKRFMGRGPDDVGTEAGLLPFGLAGEAGGVVRIRLGARDFTPPELSAFILRELKRRAEAFFMGKGEFDFEVDRAVITVPAYFNDAQRTATRDAGRLAGLDVLRIINEPTAASLAYGLDRRTRGTIAVYDLGGGTFDISILKVEEGVFQVLSTNGDTHLGGDDIDQILMARVLDEAGGGLRSNPEAVQAIRKAVIHAKWDLSEREDTEIRVGAVANLPGFAFRRRITRDEFEALIKPVVDRTVGPCRQALADAGLRPADIDEVVLVGGSTRVPMVRRAVREV
ncbi:MAG: Heat shock protein 70, partial [Acidobacteria bacterium]|nr:Heat shock protein 70 [Acidobacteriota bacterium]